MKVDIGEPEPRTIVAGIAEAYESRGAPRAEGCDRGHLQPRKLRGLTSNGMIVAASLEGGKPVLGELPGGRARRRTAEVKLVDSHCHLDDEKFAEDFDAVVERARAAASSGCCASGRATVRRIWRWRSGWPMRTICFFFFFFFFFYRRPSRASARCVEGHARELRPAARVGGASESVAIGEIGLDYHYDFSPRDVQQQVFREQLRLAGDVGKPVVIHTREAWKDTLRLIDECPPTALVMHCFTGGPEEARQCIDRGFYLSYGGVLTFPKAENVREAARMTRMTGCWWRPMRVPARSRIGQANEPAFVVDTVRKLAEVRGAARGANSELTTSNFGYLFGLPCDLVPL